MATPKTINADKLPTHCHDSLSSQTSKKDAKLNANNGRNTLNPTDAAKPIPKNMLITVSVVIMFKSEAYSSKKSSLKPIRYNFSLALVTAVYNHLKYSLSMPLGKYGCSTNTVCHCPPCDLWQVMA